MNITNLYMSVIQMDAQMHMEATRKKKENTFVQYVKIK